MHVKNFLIANSANPEDPVEGTELNSTWEVEDDLLEEPALEISDLLMSVLTNLNRNMDHMVGSLSLSARAMSILNLSSKAEARVF